MTDTGVGYYIAMGIGILVATRLAFCFFNFIIYSIRNLLNKKHNDGK
jgi:hypothetical protein